MKDVEESKHFMVNAPESIREWPPFPEVVSLYEAMTVKDPSFARRARPSGTRAATKWYAIREAFKKVVKPALEKASFKKVSWAEDRT